MENILESQLLINNDRFKCNDPLVIKIDFYRKKLIDYLYELYISNHPVLQNNSQENFDAALVLNAYINPDDPDLTRCANRIMQKNSFREITKHYVDYHLKNIMIVLGFVCEFMICDHGRSDKLLNQKLINYAAFKPDISNQYSDIDYDSYIPFSPARQFIRSESGIYIPQKFFRDGNHPTIDICWCDKHNLSKPLIVSIPNTEYTDRARLQIKTTSQLNYDIRNEKYICAPMIGVFLDNSSGNGFIDKTESNAQLARSLSEFDIGMLNEAEMYFKLLVAHFAGIWLLNKPITDDIILDNGVLRYLFSSSINNLLSETIIQNQKEKICKTAKYVNENSSVNSLIDAQMITRT